MQSQYNHDAGTNLPEVLHDERSNYIYTLPPDRSPPLSILPGKQVFHEDYKEIRPPKSSRNWTAWPLLILYGLVISVLAGLVGGLIGQAIQRNNTSTSSTPTADQALSNTSCTNVLSQSVSPSSTPTSSVSPTTRIIAIPTTGCQPTSQRRALSGTSTFLQTRYTTLCATGWASDELIGLSVATPSDCIEACAQYNSFVTIEGRPLSERTCVGGGFIPEWVDQRQAIAQNGPSPFNCYLKNGTRGIRPNDRTIEVVSLCLDGECQDALG